jgi:hypothetical protein
MIRFKLNGVPYEYDDSTLTVKEARVIKKNAGFGLVTWAKGLSEGDPDALVALVWIAKTRAGEAIRWQDLDDLDLVSLDLGGDDEDPPVKSPTSNGSRSGRTRKTTSLPT